MADAQMGGGGRPAPLVALDRTDRLHDGTVDRRAHPQPADHPGAGVHLLFPHDGEGDLQGHRLRHADRGRHPDLRQQHHHPLHGLRRGDARPFLRQHAGAARQLGHGALRTGADRRHGLGFVVHTPQRQGRVEHHPALDDHDPHRVLVLRFGDDPCRRQPADEQQQPQQPPRTDVGAQPRPVRRPAAAVRRLLLGPARRVQGKAFLLPRRGRQVQARIGHHGIYPRPGIHPLLPPHVGCAQRREGVQAMGRLPHQNRDHARRKGRNRPRLAGTPHAGRSARLRHQEGIRRRVRTAHDRRADVPREPQLFLQLPALVHVLALFPVEFRRAPERHTADPRDDHRRQLAVGHQVDRREIPRAAGRPAARNRRQQRPQHLLFPAVPAGADRTDLPAQPRPAEFLDRHVALHHDGYRAGFLFQHFAGRTA